MAVTCEDLQAAIDQFPRTELADLPTRLDDCPRFSEALGGKVRVMVKRDDLTGLALGVKALGLPIQTQGFSPSKGDEA